MDDVRGPAEGADEALRTRLHRSGRRVTGQRERVLRAVTGLGHATPDEILATVNRDGGTPVPASTVYRNLEALEETGAVVHTHLDHRAPTYHLAGHHGHLHLLCRSCERIVEVDPALATPLVESVLAEVGFHADPTHMAIHGRCAECATTEEGGA